MSCDIMARSFMNLSAEAEVPSAKKSNIPYSLEAEQAVLGALMLDNRSFDSIVDVITDAD